MREFDRLGLTLDVLELRAAEIDAVTPEFAQARGQSLPVAARASKAFLGLLRELPDSAGADALIEHFRQTGQRSLKKSQADA
jgi:hypothetical protein